VYKALYSGARKRRDVAVNEVNSLLSNTRYLELLINHTLFYPRMPNGTFEYQIINVLQKEV
jgi:hypothetical protein